MRNDHAKSEKRRSAQIALPEWRKAGHANATRHHKSEER
jgi:hypothetical protein